MAEFSLAASVSCSMSSIRTTHEFKVVVFFVFEVYLNQISCIQNTVDACVCHFHVHFSPTKQCTQETDEL